MDTFKEYLRPGTCAVCGKSTDVVVCASTFGATSYAYCEECLTNNLEPYSAMVSYISCAGYFPDDINEAYQKLCRHILNGLGISEEKFIEDVKKENEELDYWCQEYEKITDRHITELDDFDLPTHEYKKFKCPECGYPLEVYYDGARAGYPENIIIRHCEDCGCDWVNDYLDDGSESELQRKFWG